MHLFPVPPSALVAGVLAIVGLAFAIRAIAAERRMQRHRRPGVSYWTATLRRDGGWQQADLFSGEGLVEQRRAARAGVTAAVLWVLALATMVLGAAMGW